jgi:hypothetical protein
VTIVDADDSNSDRIKIRWHVYYQELHTLRSHVGQFGQFIRPSTIFARIRADL